MGCVLWVKFRPVYYIFNCCAVCSITVFWPCYNGNLLISWVCFHTQQSLWYNLLKSDVSNAFIDELHMPPIAPSLFLLQMPCNIPTSTYLFTYLYCMDLNIRCPRKAFKLEYPFTHQWLHLLLNWLWWSSFLYHTGLILGLWPTNERWRYCVMTSLISWVQA